jgi:hypothetical protein
VFLERYFASTAFAPVLETFGSAYLDQEVLNKRIGHWLVKQFGIQEVFMAGIVSSIEQFRRVLHLSCLVLSCLVRNSYKKLNQWTVSKIIIIFD